MIRAIHTIMIPGKTLFPGDVAEQDADREQRLIRDGFAESVDSISAPADDPEPAPAPVKPSEPEKPASEPDSERDPEPEPTEDADSPRPDPIKKIGRKRRK